jgi:hypothetical protein
VEEVHEGFGCRQVATLQEVTGKRHDCQGHTCGVFPLDSLGSDVAAGRGEWERGAGIAAAGEMRSGDPGRDVGAGLDSSVIAQEVQS